MAEARTHNGTERTRYPEHEARHPWLSRLLNAYHLSDEATRQDLAEEAARRGHAPACRSGCTVCCQGQAIPVSDFEALGLWWYAAEILPPAAQRRLRGQLANRRDAKGSTPDTEYADCPFLMDGACSVYPLRPFVCRQHHVFGAACQQGENLRQQRPRDVFNTGQSAARGMAWEILPLYGVGEDDVDRLFERGYVGSRSKSLDTLPLENIITHMDAAAALRKARNA